MTRRYVLADTGPLFALADPDDQYAVRAQQQVAHLDRTDTSVMIIVPVLIEAYGVILRNLGVQTAHGWSREATSSSVYPKCGAR